MAASSVNSSGGKAGRLLLRLFRRFSDCSRGAIAPLTALMMIPIVGGIAYAVELGSWQYLQRSAQNAADSAALAAATIHDTGGTSTPENEAFAVAQEFGFVDGDNGATVDSAIATCPAGVPSGAICYEAIVTTNFPLSFSRVLGFTGTDGTQQLISARAVAIVGGGGAAEDVCIWTLSGETASFTSNGGPRPDLAGCSLLSNGGMTCNGHDLGADNGIAVGVSVGCGDTQVSGVAPIEDPYADLRSNIPPDPCAGTYHQLTGTGQSRTVNVANQVAAGTPAWTGTQRVFCGDVQLQGDVTLTGDSTIVIMNGRLDLKGYQLKTASGAHATIVYGGNNGASYHHYPMSSGGSAAGSNPVIDIVAPTTGAWSGVAMYGDPNVSTNTSFTYTGNSPAWKITGLVYLPTANLTFSGVVNKASDGGDCFVVVSYTMLVNGTAQMFNNTACASSGLTPPNIVIGPSDRPKLVL
jgi:hypothetical protein